MPPMPSANKKVVLEKKSWFYGFFQSLAAFFVGSVVVSIFSFIMFFSLMGVMLAMFRYNRKNNMFLVFKLF